MDIAPVDDIARAQLAMAKSGKKGAEKLGVGKWRPVALSSIALTNKPHFDLAPALGREQSQQGDSNMDPTQILAAIRAALGIDDSADMVQAVKKLVSDSASATAQATEAKTALAAVQAKQLDAEADAFVTLHQARIKNADAVKAQFRKDPEATKALFGSLADAPAATTTRQTRVLARADASTPADAAAATAASAQCAQERARVIASIQKDQGCTYRAAYAIAERTRRDLFPARETATA